MLAVDGQDRCVILLGQLENQFTSYHKCLLIRQTDSLTSLDGMDGGVKAGKADHRCKYHVDGASLDNLVERLGTSIYLDLGHVAHQRFQFIVTLLVGNHNGSRLELVCLLCQQFHFIVGGQAIDLIQVTMFLNNLKGLCPYRPRRAENSYLFLHNSRMPSGRLISI